MRYIGSITLQWRHNGQNASQITGKTTVCWAVCSDAHQRKHQSSASLGFVRGIHRWIQCVLKYRKFHSILYTFYWQWILSHWIGNKPLYLPTMTHIYIYMYNYSYISSTHKQMLPWIERVNGGLDKIAAILQTTVANAFPRERIFAYWFKLNFIPPHPGNWQYGTRLVMTWPRTGNEPYYLNPCEPWIFP